MDEPEVIELPLNIRRFTLFFGLVLIILGALLTKTFWLQIVKGEYYKQKSSANSIRIYEIPARRGIIYDRDGKALVENIPAFDLFLVPSDLPQDKDELDNWVKTVAVITSQDKEKVFEFLKSLDRKSVTPEPFLDNIDIKIVLELEAQKLSLPGILVNETTARSYKDGPFFAHVLGYLRQVSPGVLKRDDYYSLSDKSGVTGIENQYEKDLRGIKGRRAFTVNARGVVLRAASTEDPVPGNDLRLNISANLQKIAFESLQEELSLNGVRGGAVVIMNPKNGEVLALVSLPAFDNNLFSQAVSQSDYAKLVGDPARPLFNRATSGSYPSGSTIKPMVAAAALQEKIIDPNRLVDDTKGYITIPNQYNPQEHYIFKDWKAHGFIDMRRAIAVSANVYFYTIGGGYGNIKGLGIGLINKYLSLFGLGATTAIDFPSEAVGLIPTPEWKKSAKKESWFLGDTYHVSIGQGDLVLTPLQLINAISAIANGGTLFQPQILKEVVSPEGAVIYEFQPKVLREKFVDPKNLQVVREGMRQTVTEGSAVFLSDLPVKAAGKTGTAQFGSQSKAYAWFVGFAPYDNPEVSFAIVAEGVNEGAFVAVPVAKKILEWYFNQPNNVIK